MKDMMIIEPKMFMGQDGNIYPSFAFMEHGRGWETNQLYSAGVGIEIKPLQIRKVAHHRGKVWVCEVLNPQDFIGQKFCRVSKRPYVRKDGSFVVFRTENKRDFENLYCMYQFKHGSVHQDAVDKGWCDGSKDALFCYMSL